MVIKKP